MAALAGGLRAAGELEVRGACEAQAGEAVDGREGRMAVEAGARSFAGTRAAGILGYAL